MLSLSYILPLDVGVFGYLNRGSHLAPQVAGKYNRVPPLKPLEQVSSRFLGLQDFLHKKDGRMILRAVWTPSIVCLRSLFAGSIFAAEPSIALKGKADRQGKRIVLVRRTTNITPRGIPQLAKILPSAGSPTFVLD